MSPELGINFNNPLSICAFVTVVDPVIATPFKVKVPFPLVPRELTVTEDNVFPSSSVNP